MITSHALGETLADRVRRENAGIPGLSTNTQAQPSMQYVPEAYVPMDESTDDDPIWKKWQFWAGVGVVAVGAFLIIRRR